MMNFCTSQKFSYTVADTGAPFVAEMSVGSPRKNTFSLSNIICSESKHPKKSVHLIPKAEALTDQYGMSASRKSVVLEYGNKS